MCAFAIILISKRIMTFQSESLCISLNKNINLKKNTEFKMENPTPRVLEETNLVLQLIQEMQIKGESLMSWSTRKKN